MFGVRLSKMGSASKLGLIAKAIGILRKYGTDAHIYLPGVGTVNGITAGNYLDSAGTTAATVDNPVGLSLDALQAMTLGDELVDTSVGAIGSVFAIRCTNTAMGGGFWAVVGNDPLVASVASQNPLLSYGKTYLVTLEISAVSGGNVALHLSDAQNSGLVGSPFLTKNSVGIYTAIITPDTVTIDSITALCGTSGLGVTFKVSVREIPGIHATQATTANKPILRRGLLNQLTYSQAANNAAWLKIGATNAPNATTVNFPNTLEAFYNTYSVSAPAGSSWTGVFLLSGVGAIRIITARWTGGAYEEASSDITLSATPTLYAVTHTLANAQTGILTGVSRASVGQATSVSFGGGGLFQGTLTAQQILDAGGIPLTTTAAASSTTGKYWWQFDGSNDSLLTGNLGITNTVSVVIAGVVNSLSAFQILCAEFSNGVQVAVDTPGTLSLAKVGGANLVESSAGAIVAGVPFVVTLRLQGGVASIRKNGVQIATAASAATFSATTGMRFGTTFNGVSYPFNGSIYSVDVITATTTDSHLLTLERLAGQMAGVSI